MVVLGRLSPERRLAPPAGQHLKFHGQKAWDQGVRCVESRETGGSKSLLLFLQAYSSRFSAAYFEKPRLMVNLSNT